MEKMNMRENNAVIRERISTLAKEERLIVYLHFWEERTPAYIAGVLGLKKELVEKALLRGLAKLKTELQAFV